jgi:hypothetical protein
MAVDLVALGWPGTPYVCGLCHLLPSNMEVAQGGPVWPTAESHTPCQESLPKPLDAALPAEHDWQKGEGRHAG